MTAQGVSVDAKVVGVRETLAALKDLDPALRRQTLTAMRKAAQPLAAAVSQALPGEAPVSGMNRGTPRWSGASSKATARTGGRKRSSRNEWPLVTVKALDGAASMADMAGRGSRGSGSGATLIGALTARGGSSSRYVWPAAERVMPEVQRAVVQACEDAAAQVNKRLDVRPPGA